MPQIMMYPSRWTYPDDVPFTKVKNEVLELEDIFKMNNQVWKKLFFSSDRTQKMHSLVK